jgi:hypothetical protein
MRRRAASLSRITRSRESAKSNPFIPDRGEVIHHARVFVLKKNEQK